MQHSFKQTCFLFQFFTQWKTCRFCNIYIYICFIGDAVNTKSKRQSEKLPLKTPAVEAAITPPDPVKDVKSLEEVCGLSLEADPAKDCKKGSKGKNTMDRQSTKSGASSAAPRITIKLVAKKKVQTVKQPHKKSGKKLKIKGIQDQSTAKDIQEDKISSAHFKLKTEPHEDKNGTQDKGGGTVPARRRGRSASKTTKPVCQTGAKVVVDDQKSKERKSDDQCDAGKESGVVEPRANAKKNKLKENTTEQGSEANQQVIRRSNRVTNPLSKRFSDSAAEPDSVSNSGAIMTESKSVSRIVETKPLVRSDRRRQSKRLNKDVTVPENHGPSSTEEENLALQPSDSLPLKNEETKVPSLKLMRIRNPKYDAQTSGKNPARKKKRRKFIWTLTLVKGGSQTQGAENTVKVAEKAMSEVDQSTFCDTSNKTCVNKTLKGIDNKSTLDNSAPQEIKSTDKNECTLTKVDTSFEDKSTLQVEIEVEHIAKTPLQDITKIDEKVVPPLQIKKVSSPGKHKSSKPSFLIQQVSPVPENKEDVLKELSEVNEDNSSSQDAEVTPTRRLRRRTASLDSPQTKSVSHKPMTTPKQRLRSSPQYKDILQVDVEDSSQVSTEDSSSQVLPENSCQVLPEEFSQVSSVNSSEVPDQGSSKVAEDVSQVPGEVSPQKMENELPQIKEAKLLPVPSKPRRCRNNKLVKKKSAQKKKVVVSSETAVHTELTTVGATNSESLLKEDAQPVVTEESPSEAKDCTKPEAKQDTVSVEEEQIQPPVKEETDIQLIDSQQSVVLDSQENDPKTCLQTKSLKKVKKRRKSLIGQRQKHRHRGRDGKFAPLTLSENQEVVEGDSDISTPLTTTTLDRSSKLIGVHKKYKKRHSGLQFIGSKRPKPPSKILSKLIEMELDKDSLKQEETDTLVDGGQSNVVDTHPGKSKFVKNIRHFIMPVVSARSSRVIKTPQRFMDDAGMSVLPRRNSPKKGLQLGLQIRPGKRRDDETDRAMSPILAVNEEDILSEAQLDVDLFSAQDLDDNLDIDDGLFSDSKGGKNEKRRSFLKNSSFKWHMPEESNEEVYTLDKTPENKCEDLFSSTPVDKPTELSTDLPDGQKKKSSPKFNKQTAHLKIYQRLKKPQTGLPKSKNTTEMDSVSKPLQPPVDLAEGLDDEAMSISLRQRNTNAEKEKSKLKIEDLDTPGVVRKVSVCVRTTSKSLVLQHSKEKNLAEEDTAQLHSGKRLVLIIHLFYYLRTIEGKTIVVAQTLSQTHVTYDFVSTGEVQSEQKSGTAEGDCLGTVEKGSSQRARLTGANKRMFNLLRKAKVQLIKIDQQKQLKSSGVRSCPVQAHF